MNHQAIFQNRSGLNVQVLLAAAFVSVVALLCGCSSDKELTYESREQVVLPPSFLSGAAGVLLTNSSGFSAQLTVEPPPSPIKQRVVSGILLGQGSHLLFSPTGSDRTFIWDVSEHSGWILSEALQGYAPVSSIEQFTNVTILSETAGPVSMLVNGHPGHEAEIAVASSLGPAARFSVWRASDLNGLPVRITPLGGNQPSIIQLNNVRRETLAAKLFQPPQGFTRFASPDAIADEVFTRKAKMRAPTVTTMPVGTPQAPQAPPRQY